MRAAIAIAGPLFAVLLLPGSGGAQSPPAGRGGAPPGPANYPPYTRPVSAFVPPRTADGQPNISGLYVAIPLPRGIETPMVPVANRPNRANSEFSYSLNERPKLPEGAIVRPVGVDPPDGKIPLTPEALARRKDIIANQDKVQYLDGRVLCLAPGVPRSTIPAPVVGYQIFQKPGYVVIFYEQNHLYRTIPLDARAPLDPNIRKAMGVSRGHWEGNVLVVEVSNFTTNLDNNWVIGAISATPGVPAESLTTGHGIPHSDLYRVTERYTPIDANTIHYEARIEDPKVFTQPWTIAYYAFARAPKDYVPVEYACFEGNDKNLMLMTNTDISGVRVIVP
ncbi:MAG TPA: hypothetical protein VGY48_11680 [Vicinamibacterales bacterium]|nr:hypothetical protein [Vicinamibacterales bacterium]